MPKLLLVEEVHLSLLAPDNLTSDQREAIRQVLDASEFRTGLQNVLLGFLALHPELSALRVRIGR